MHSKKQYKIAAYDLEFLHMCEVLSKDLIHFDCMWAYNFEFSLAEVKTNV